MRIILVLPLVALLSSCTRFTSSHSMPIAKDIQSFSNPQQIVVRHVELDLAVLFEQKSLKGSAVLGIEHVDSQARELILDTRELQIDETETSNDNTTFHEAKFQLGDPQKYLGRPLTIQIPGDAKFVRVKYSTSPSASGLQWLTPEQTMGKNAPFLFTQSEAIHARSWIPLQDSPGVRITYTAHITTPKNLLAVMGADHDALAAPTGDYRFHMNERIPSYLVALAVGDIGFQSTGARTGVYAEKPLLAKAAKEFEDTEKMLREAEQLYGPYRWGRYDILVLPPSFPYGGMENPRLTFATPTVIAGDKSLVSLVAHEMAHSWSGNLVTNATWSDFWLNEGFTVYLERRIIEQVYGREREEMEAALGRQELEQELAGLAPADQILHISLTGRDPDDGMTNVPYEKGALLLRAIEGQYGREKFDAFLKGYFEHFSFQSITTAQFLDYIRRNLPDIDSKIPMNQWIFEAGLPAGAPKPVSDLFAKVEQAAASVNPDTTHWSTQEWLHFLRGLKSPKMGELDEAYHLTQSGNDEILQQWLLMSVRNRYEAAYPKLEEFLVSVGRRKYLKPLYEELVKTPEGKERARAIYEKARAGYHPIAQTTIDGIVGK